MENPAENDCEKQFSTQHNPSGSLTPTPENTVMDLPALITSPTSTDDNQDVCNRFSTIRRRLIVLTVGYSSFLAPINSAALLVAVPEIAAAFKTTPVMVNLANTLFFLSMGTGPLFWGPVLSVVGRRPIFLISSMAITAFTIATAASPNLPAFLLFHMIAAFHATAYLITGSVVVADLYPPEKRGREMSWMMSGLLCSIIFAPLMGGAIITSTSWRIIFWVLAGMSFTNVLMILFCLPETSHHPVESLKGRLQSKESVIALCALLHPGRVIKPLFRYPNLWISALAAGSLMWNQYALLTPIRYVINPRFDIHSPIMSALFFIPPGLGYVTGSFIGGSWSDFIVRKFIAKRGRRVPEDRLRAAIWIMGIFVPGSMLIYGWAVEKAVGGIPLVIIAMFLQGLCQLLCVPSLNTYGIDVMQDKGMSDIAVSGSYLSRYLFSAAASLACFPAIESIGVGWFSTISSIFIVIVAVMIWMLAQNGERWRQSIDGL